LAPRGIMTIIAAATCAGPPAEAASHFRKVETPGSAPEFGQAPGFFVAGMVTLDFSKLDGLVPAIVQDSATRDVLMVGFMNEEAFRRTCDSGFVTFFSRTRQKLWTKGETSGNRLAVEEIRVDCDQDSLVVLARQTGGATCHLGYRSCFFRRLVGAELREIETKAEVK
jgi:phosphoribosyl-AMP cyclohydrolase